MTNTTQTDLLEELLGDYWDTAFKEGLTGESYGDEANATLCQIRETVEALLEANRKQVLLEAEARVRRFITHPNASNEMVKAFNAAWSDAAYELRRMALEPTGVDKGEKE